MSYEMWILLLSLALGMTSRAVADDNEDRAAAAIVQFGGRVWRDDAAPGRPVIDVGLYSFSIKDSDLRALAGLKRLHSLQVVGAEVTDVGLKEIAKVTSLEWLQLTATPVTNAGMRELLTLTKLRTLSLWSTTIGNAGLKDVAQLDGLAELYLCGTYVCDDGLKELLRLKKLTKLSLSSTGVTDTGVRDLAQMKSLTYLNLEFTSMTEAGVAELQKALPKCHIVYYRPKAGSRLTVLELTGKGNAGTVVGLTPSEAMDVEPEKIDRLRNWFILEPVEDRTIGVEEPDSQPMEPLLFPSLPISRRIELPVWFEK